MDKDKTTSGKIPLPNPQPEGIKIIGKIDLNQINQPHVWHKHHRKFRLLDAIVEDENGTYDVILYDGKKELCNCGISLIVGKNGVGKSYLFRAIIEFFVDFNWFVRHEFKRPYSNSRYRINQLRYVLDRHEYLITRDTNKFISKINGDETSSNDVIIPNIVAAHFGLYDRFPIKRDRYDVDIYNYVGAKAGGNFISTNNIITQMLFSLCEDREEKVLRRIIKAFANVGYDPKVTIKVRLRETEKITSFEDFRTRLEQQVQSSSTFNASLFKKIGRYTVPQKRDLYRSYKRLKENSEVVLDLREYDSFVENRKYFSDIYLLKQLQFTSKLNFYFYRNSKERDCNSLSSGEINMLATTVSVASCINDSPILILLDEPELNQHPNWQMSIITQLYEIFGDFTCHLLIASHSHFLVSDLPGEKSVVIQMDSNKGELISKTIPEDTYGWSAEQVLLEVFQTGTDRNMYLGHILGELLDRIKIRDIDISEVREKIDFLARVSENLKEFDPLKKIIISLIAAFNSKK